MITGLVAITPAAGLVTGWGAIIIGIVSGSLPWLSMNYLGKVWPFFTRVDYCLGVFHTHMVAGFAGGIMTGLFATVEGCQAFGYTNPGGAIAGNWYQVWLQLVGVLCVIALNIIITSIILLAIKLVIPLRMSDEVLEIGDDAIHGEEAYAFFFDGQRSMINVDLDKSPDDLEAGETGEHIADHRDVGLVGDKDEQI